MGIYKPSVLHNFLSQINANPKKNLSQNFLIDKNIVNKILEAAEVKKDDFIVEIGPGPGVLTEALLNLGAFVFAIEKDNKFAQALSRFQTYDQRLTVFENDALNFDFSILMKTDKPLKLIANLPYNIATPILINLLPKHTLFSSITVMVQKEVGKRLLAKPSSKDYGSLTIFTNFYSNPRLRFHINPHCFYPAPKVVSSVITFFLCQPDQNIKSENGFFTFVRQCFQQRRKMIKNSLKSFYSLDMISTGLNAIHRSNKIRAEDLTLDEFVLLFNQICHTDNQNQTKEET